MIPTRARDGTRADECVRSTAPARFAVVEPKRHHNAPYSSKPRGPSITHGRARAPPACPAYPRGELRVLSVRHHDEDLSDLI